MGKLIYGRGEDSGGGEARSAVEYPDTLKSKSYVKVIDLLGEGEYEEVLVGGLRGLYLDDVPVQNSDGTLNYTGLNVETRTGSLSQSRMTIGGTVENTESVGIEMTKDNPIEKVVSVENTDIVRVNVRIPTLTLTDTTNGDLKGTSVQYKIEWKELSGPSWNTVLDGTYVKQSVMLAKEVSSAYVTGYTSYSYTVEAFADSVQGGSDYRQVTAFGTSLVTIQTNKNNAGWVTVKTEKFTNKVQENYPDSWHTEYYAEVTPYIFSATISAIATDIVQVRTLVSFVAAPPVTMQYITSTSSGVAVIKSLTGTRTTPTGIQTVSGKSSGEYERQTSFRVSGASPWIIRCTRISDDSTSSYLQNKTYFSSVTSVLEEKFRYPGSALVGMQVDAEQFSSIPSRGYLCKCLKVKVPTNYDPVERSYTGVWDGSFKIAWTDNPAWCFYDLLTNTRYGLGDRIPSSFIDKASLYSISQYCDEMVVGEDGVFEPRFTCNVVIQTKEEAYKVINDFASVFRGITYWGSGAVVPVQDSPRGASYAFNNTNVVDGVFTYQSSPLSSRYNAVGVTWISPRKGYEREIEYVEDTDLINSLGYINQTEVVAFGCTSRAMARRVGKWLIYTNNYQTDIVTFSTGIEGVVPLPGEVIKVSDVLRSQDRRGGRIRSSTLSSAVLDSQMTFLTGVTYTFSAIDITGVLVDRTFVYTGTTDTITFETPLINALAANSIFIVADDNIEPQLFKIVAVTEKGGSIHEVSALSYNESKYTFVEQDIPLSSPNVAVGGANEPVSNITYAESLYKDGVSVKSKVEVAWNAPKFAAKYIVTTRAPDGSVSTESVVTPSTTYLDTTPGVYELSVVSVNLLGNQSQPTPASISVLGKTAPPNDVVGFSVKAVGGKAYVSWDTPSDLDVLVGGFVQILHSSKTSGAGWSDGIEIEKVSGSTTSALVPLLGGTYMAKAIDSSGVYSETPAYDFADYALTQNKNVVESITEHPLFAGSKTNTSVVGGMLTLSSDMLIDDAGIVDSFSLFDYLGGGVLTTGEYVFANMIDMGDVYTVNLVGNISAFSAEVFSLIDSRTENIDSWQFFDVLEPNTASIKLYLTSTNDDPSGTPTWSEWAEFRIATYAARAFKFKLVVQTVSDAYTVFVEELSVDVDVEDRVTGENDVICPIVGKTFAFTPPYMGTPSVSVSINNMEQGDYYEVTTKTSNGFDVIVKNAGVPVERVIDYIAKGYGYKS